MYEILAALVKQWKGAYARRPRLTVIVTLILAGALVSSYFYAEAKGQEAARLNVDLNRQPAEMDRVKGSLQGLLTLVEDQRTKIQWGQETIASLSREQSQLKPIVRSQRQVIDQIFAIQSQKAKRDVSGLLLASLAQ